MNARLVRLLCRRGFRVPSFLPASLYRVLGRTIAFNPLRAAVWVLDQNPVCIGVDHFVRPERWRLQIMLAILLLLAL